MKVFEQVFDGALINIRAKQYLLHSHKSVKIKSHKNKRLQYICSVSRFFGLTVRMVRVIIGLPAMTCAKLHNMNIDLYGKDLR